MSRFVLVLGLAATAYAGIISNCPEAMNTGSVGSCKWFNCAASRGPTECDHGSCYCPTGYCRYPASTLHIQARYCVADVKVGCHLYCSGENSFCTKRHCMCKFGFKLSDDGVNCEADAGVAGIELVLAGNMTQEDRAGLLSLHQEGLNSDAIKTLVFLAYVAGVSAVLMGGFVFLRRRATMEKDSSEGYSALLAGA